MSTSHIGAMTAIRLVATRELQTRTRTRAFVVTNIILLAAIIIGIVVASLFTGDGGVKNEKYGLVGISANVTSELTTVAKGNSVNLTTVTLPDSATARAQVDSGDIALAIVATPNSPTAYQAITKDGLGGTAATIVRTALSSAGLDQALRNQGANPQAVTSDAARNSTLNVSQINPSKPESAQRIAIAYIGVGLLLFAITTGGSMIAVGVVEEKTSRIVELLLSTIRPLHLLWGKIIGIGTMILAQLVAICAVGLITATATNVLTIASTAVWMFVAVIAWFLLGFLFFATLYAAAASLVTRQEESNSATMPLTLLSLATLYAAIFGINAINSTPIVVLSWIPPFSATLMPMRIATGDASAIQIALTLVIMVFACAAATWVASRVYQRSVLRTGTRTKWLEALRATPAVVDS